MMNRQVYKMFPALLLAGALLCQSTLAFAETKPAASIPAADQVLPAALAASLQDKAAARPLILQVGFQKLYAEAHIPGAEYVGPAREDGGLQALRQRVAKLPHDSALVIYCGCCPWSRCPNIAAAYDQLHALGFTNVKVLYIAEDFGTDWVSHGYPVDHGG